MVFLKLNFGFTSNLKRDAVTGLRQLSARVASITMAHHHKLEYP